MTGGVNRGIIDCYRDGVVTSTTLMVNGEASAPAAALAAENPGLGVGLHLNLTTGRPVLPPRRVPSLLGRDGRFPGKGYMIARLSTGSISRAELDAEIGAQIAACRALGIKPTHIDSHHHLHAHPEVAAALLRVCPGEGIHRARGYRMKPRSPRAAGIRLAAVMPWPGRARGGAGMITPERFAGIEEMGSLDIAGKLASELEADGDSLEFMCHPGYTDETLRRLTSYSDLRETELAALLSQRLRDVIEDAGAELTGFSGLVR